MKKKRKSAREIAEKYHNIYWDDGWRYQPRLSDIILKAILADRRQRRGKRK